MRTKLKLNEKSILVAKQHWLVVATPIFWSIIFLIFAAMFPPLFVLFGISLLVSIYKIIERSKNLWIVTNLRIIDEQGVFSVSSKETPLDKINNVTYQKSLFGRMFDYGNLQIQSAAEKGSTVHKMIGNPKKLRDTITDLTEKYKQEQIQTQAREFAKAAGQAISSGSSSGSVVDELEKLHSLKEKGIISEDEYNAMKSKILDS